MPISVAQFIAQQQGNGGSKNPVLPQAKVVQPPKSIPLSQFIAQAKGSLPPSDPVAAPKLGDGPAGDLSGNAVRAVAAPLIRTGGAIEDALSAGVRAMGGKVLPSMSGQEANDTADKLQQGATPGIAGDVGTALGTIAPYFSGLGEEEIGAKLGEFIPKLAEKLGMDSKSVVSKVSSYLTSKIPTFAKDTSIGTAQTGSLKSGVETGGVGVGLSGGLDVLKAGAKGARTAIAKSNVLPQVETAVKRINEPEPKDLGVSSSVQDKGFTSDVGVENPPSPKGELPSNTMKQGIGKSTIKDPAALHAQYYNQEKNALADTKQDTALGMVGSDAGKAFESVIKMKQQVGAKMASELEKFRNVKTDITPVVSKFEKELNDSGASFKELEEGAGKAIANSTESSFSSADTKILQKYAEDLDRIGTSPTAKQIQAFVSRMPNEIKALKSTAGINFKTNAERIVSKSLNDMRDSLSSVSTPAYREARAKYSSLSNTIEEGAKFFGKKTASGDFAKDASLVKSSVQSALNGGKKDFLLNLEKLTGEPIIDKATLALQAMKDAGDYRGESLLQLLSDGGDIPTSPHSFMSVLANGAVNLGKRAFAGSKFDQTQRILKSI